MLDALVSAAGHTFAWPGILIPIAGTLLAMVVSFLPGIGSSSIMMLMLVLTLSWPVEWVLLLFGALTGGATFMGSITAILFNIPGGAPNAATLLDGYPLGQRGYPRTAIACAATASAVGSVIGVLVLLAILPVIRPVLLEFGPLERLLLGVWGLTTIVTVPNVSPLKSAIMAMLGLLVAMIGTDPVTGNPRWAFGVDALHDGIGVVPALLGFFTLAEILGWTRRYQLDAPTLSTRAPDDSTRAGILAVFRHPGVTLRSSLIGTLVGVIPGVGGTVAGFVAYGQAAQSARTDRERFGKGDIRGLIAPEAAVDAKDGGSLLPVVAFGLPGSEAGVILLTVILLHGLVPGLPMLDAQLSLTMILIVSLLFSNLLTSVIGVVLTPQLARMGAVRTDRIALPALLVSLFTIVQIEGRITDLYVAIAFGVLGYLCKRHDWPRVPFVIAFVLGAFIERNIELTARLLELSRVDPLQRPATLALAVMILASLAWMGRARSRNHATGSNARIDFRFALATLAVMLALAAALLTDNARASLYLLVVLGGASLMLVLVALRAKARQRAADGQAPRLVDPWQRRGLLCMVLLPGIIWLVGLPVAFAALVLCWNPPPDVDVSGRQSARRAIWLRRLVVAAAVGIASHYLAHEVFHLLLPRGRLFEG